MAPWSFMFSFSFSFEGLGTARMAHPNGTFHPGKCGGGPGTKVAGLAGVPQEKWCAAASGMLKC